MLTVIVLDTLALFADYSRDNPHEHITHVIADLAHSRMTFRTGS